MKTRFKDRVLNSTPITKVFDFADKIKVSKTEDVSLFTAIDYFIKELKNNDINSEAKSVAFSFTLAIFPSIIFFFTLIPYFHLPWLTETAIVEFLRDGLQLPQAMYEGLSETILDIAHKPRGGLLSVGFAMALFMATNGMLALMDAFNKCYRSKEKRHFVKRRLIAIALTGMLSLVLIMSMIVLVFGSSILNLLENYGVFPIWIIEFVRNLRIIEYGVFFLLFFFAISMIYYFAPAIHKRWRFFSYGAFIATLLSVLISALFSFYVNNFGTYNKLYGSIGTLIGFLIWLNFITLVILIGFEINVSIDRAKIDSQKRNEKNVG